jgi:hypothetical protein
VLKAGETAQELPDNFEERHNTTASGRKITIWVNTLTNHTFRSKKSAQRSLHPDSYEEVAAKSAAPAQPPPKKRQSPKGPKGPKGARTSYILWGNDERLKLKIDSPNLTQPEIVKVLGAKWKDDVTAEEKAKYGELAKADRERADREKKAWIAMSPAQQEAAAAEVAEEAAATQKAAEALVQPEDTLTQNHGNTLAQAMDEDAITAAKDAIAAEREGLIWANWPVDKLQAIGLKEFHRLKKMTPAEFEQALTHQKAKSDKQQPLADLNDGDADLNDGDADLNDGDADLNPESPSFKALAKEIEGPEQQKDKPDVLLGISFDRCVLAPLSGGRTAGQESISVPGSEVDVDASGIPAIKLELEKLGLSTDGTDADINYTWNRALCASHMWTRDNATFMRLCPTRGLKGLADAHQLIKRLVEDKAWIPDKAPLPSSKVATPVADQHQKNIYTRGFEFKMFKVHC